MMEIKRIWAMPNKDTFSIKPIKELIAKYVKDTGMWVDPFAGQDSPYGLTNDLNPKKNAMYSMDALEFLKTICWDNKYDGVLFDPPYSPRQLKECYDSIGQPLHDTKSSVWSKWKDEVARIVKPEGYCLSFGWSTQGMGKCRGFKIVEILLVPHGGNHNDTICVVEQKIADTTEKTRK